MSTLKVNAIRGTGASSDAVTLVSDGSCTVKATNRLDERNLLLNPEMRIDQRNSGATYAMNPSSGNPTYGIVDRWFFQNYAGEAARYDVTTAMGTPATQNYSSLCQYIEAQDAVYLNHGNANAKTLSLSFWIKSTKTGTASICLDRDDASRCYVAEYTISSANTWEKKTITIPGDTTGTACANDNGRGLNLLFTFFAGSGRHQSVGSWAARPGGWYGASANQVNLIDSTSNDIYITGVSLTATDYFPDFEHKSYADELARCERYYQVLASGAGKYISNGYFYNANVVVSLYNLRTEMRATPSIDQTTGSSYYRIYQGNTYHSFNAFEGTTAPSKYTGAYYIDTAASVTGTQNAACGFYIYNAAGHLAMEAEL